MADDLDPADWLASQFGEEEPEKPRRRRGMPAADSPASQPSPAHEPPPAPPAVQPPPVEPASQFFAAQPYTPPPAPQAPPPASPSGGGFTWGLTPGTPVEPAIPTPPVQPQPAPAPAPAAPPSWQQATEPAPVQQPAPLTPGPPAADPAPDPFAALFGQQPAPLVEPAAPPVVAAPPAPPAWDVPTVATPVFREGQAPAVDPAPTVAFGGAELARQEFPGFGAPVDPAIEGVTEVLGAQPIGLGAPEDEGPEVSALDSLFGESSFVEYEDALIPALQPRASGGAGGGELVVVSRPTSAEDGRAPISRLQKILMGVAGGLVAVLLLIVLFLAGQRIAANSPAPAVVSDPTPSASAAPTTGPLPPGEYYWDRLLGGECIAPFTSPWEDTFTVVPCTQSHPAQLVLKGTFPDTVDTDYPGVDELQKLAASLCTAPTVIDYAATASASDIQVLASFAADEQDWLDGNRTFYCFVNRTGGAEFTTSIAKPQPTPSATPAP